MSKHVDRLGDRARTSLHLALIVLLVVSHPLWAATIIVDNTTCTLSDAITAANTDSPVGGCPAGSGTDTIELTADVSLTGSLPTVTTHINFAGGGFTVERPQGEPSTIFYTSEGPPMWDWPFVALDRINLRNISLHASLALLTITNSTVSGSDSHGLKLLNGEYPGESTISHTTFAGHAGNGILVSHQSSVALCDCIVENNAEYGIEIYSDHGSIATLDHSHVSGNTAGGIRISMRQFGGFNQAVLTNSTVSGNEGPGVLICSS